jgi:hypothetical protein
MQYEPRLIGKPQLYLVRLGSTLCEAQAHRRQVRDPRRTHVLAPSGPEPHHLSLLAEYREIPPVCLPLRRGYPTLVMAGIIPAGPPSRAGLTPPGGRLPRLLRPTLLVSCWTRFSLRHYPQQGVPAKPGAAVTSDASPPVSAVCETAFAAAPVLDPPSSLGNWQAPELLAFIQGMSR